MGKARNDVLCVKYSLTGEDQRAHAVDLRIRSRNQTDSRYTLLPTQLHMTFTSIWPLIASRLSYVCICVCMKYI